MDCSLPGSSVHGILQAGILEWVAIPFFQGIFLTQGLNLVSCIVSRFFTICTIRETQESSLLRQNSIKGARADVWKTTVVFFIRSDKLPELWLLEEFQE